MVKILYKETRPFCSLYIVSTFNFYFGNNFRNDKNISVKIHDISERMTSKPINHIKNIFWKYIWR